MTAATALAIQLATLGIGTAVTPPGIVVLLALLASRDGLRKGVAFTAGIFTVLLTASALGYFLTGLLPPPGTQPPAFVSWGTLFIGVAVIAAGVWIWTRPAAAVGGVAAKALARVDTISLPFAFFLGLVLINFLLCPVAVAAIREAGLQPSVALAFYLEFLLIATCTMWVPVLLSALMPTRWARWSSRFEEWTIAHGNAVFGIVILVIGVAMAWGGAQQLIGG